MLFADAHYIRFEEAMEYHLPLLFRNIPEARTIGVTHECLDMSPFPVKAVAEGLSVIHRFDGSSRPEKYERDIRLLKQSLETDPANPRSWFYLAQSYRETNQFDLAVATYAKRVELAGWDEERWYAQYQLARCCESRGDSWPQIQNAYLEAYQTDPSRLEPLLPLARHYRELGMMQLAFMFSRPCTETPYPNSIFFVDQKVYNYELPTEYAIACYWLGLHEEAVRVNDLILQNTSMPDNYRNSAVRNRQLSIDELTKASK